ncbi:hypothetical protein GA0111570_10770 [Raineyella antarctica]|uniref:DUF1684 domain-containing protein n=1 Tax=Raineyella antarctica TaxID=1577474 RepID=A0A1G6H732_9ACTN|nr:DUF1684 domain-containing protein [Raineyella antarctica]SDB90089.1 hypothetical protein GA0111570_10770 [Raineyella antarctica]
MSTPDWTTWARGEWRRWRVGRERRLADPYGWLSVTSLEWLDETPRAIDGFPGLWSGDEDDVRVELTEEDGVQRDGSPISGLVEIPLQEDESDDTLFHDGTVAEAGIRGGRPMVRLRNPDAPARAAFTGVPSYDWDDSWVVPAHFREYPETVVREIDTAYPGVRQPMTFWGEVTFTRGDTDVTLVVSGGTGSAFAVFHDPTNGMDTADWRSVPLGEVDPAGGTTLDFNRATNFPSAFIPGLATCPRPVPENEVPFPVTAGEQRPTNGDRRGE